MFGILFRAEIKPEEREDFIKWDIQVPKEREPGTLRFDFVCVRFYLMQGDCRTGNPKTATGKNVWLSWDNALSRAMHAETQNC